MRRRQTDPVETGDSVVRARTSVGKGVHHAGIYETRHFYTSQIALLHRLISRTMKRAFDVMFGMTLMEWRVLAQLEYRSPSKISEIHERSLMQKPLTSTALRSLVENGYAVRESDPYDARAPNFYITEKGLQTYKAVLAVTRKRQHGLESLFTAQEQKIMAAAFTRLIEFYTDEERQRDNGMFAKTPKPKRKRRRE
jgi:DNA-binding MarR family transcriptional regulator